MLMTGEEVIEGADAVVRDFWAWSLSDLRTNTARSRLAEYLVARALGASDQPRIEWDAYDVLTPEGLRLEVKSGAYLQAWEQTRLSTVTFTGLSARQWSAADGYSSSATFNADGYVFGVHMAKDHAAYDALAVGQWSFWVLPRDVIVGLGQRSIRLSRVEALAGAAVSYAGLAAKVRSVVRRQDLD